MTTWTFLFSGRNRSSKRILKIFLGFQIPPIFCINHLVVAPTKRILNFFLGFQIPPILEKKKILAGKKRHITTGKKKDTIVIHKHLKKNPKIFFGFSDPANFLHQPPSSSSLKKNPKFFLGFQIPPIFCMCISTLKKNPKFFFGFSDPANFLHQPAS